MRRVPGGRTGTVYALTFELEGWLASDEREAAAASPSIATTQPPVAVVRAPGWPLWGTALLALLALAAAVFLVRGRGAPARNPPVSIATLAPASANPATVAFARSLNADLARFANASPDLAIYESEAGHAVQTQYAVSVEIGPEGGKMVAHARLLASPKGQVIWSRRFEQSGPALSALREQVAANLINILRCSFGGLDTERSKVRPADLEQLMAICESFDLRDLPAAEARARQLTRAHPDLSLGWALLAMTQGEMVGEGSDVRALALANSRVAAKIAPDGLNTWLARVSASPGGPTDPQALPVIDAAMRSHPDEPWLLEDRSVILFNLGYVRASVIDTLRAVRNDPSGFEARDIAIRRLAAAGRTEEAQQLQAENERLWPGHPRVAANRALIAPVDGGRRDADMTMIATSERALAASPSDAYLLARLLERTGNHRAALARLARAPATNAFQQWSQLFWPDAVGLRREPDFFRKMADLGLVRWWIARRRWPDFCAEPDLKYECSEEAKKLVK